MNVWTNGCFDLLHRGHIEMLQYARSLGHSLVVGIDSDTRVQSSKGPTRPINSVTDRKAVLEALGAVDKVEIFNSDDELCQCIKDNNIDIMVVGSDWKGKPVVGAEYANEVRYFKRISDLSTTQLIEKSGKTTYVWEKEMTYIVDIDGTICSNHCETKGSDYSDSLPNKERIEKLNKLYDEGHNIIYMTARGMGRHMNNPQAAIEDFYAFTKSQLDNWGCKYHSLFLGKPAGDVYIDDKGVNDVDFFTN